MSETYDHGFDLVREWAVRDFQLLHDREPCLEIEEDLMNLEDIEQYYWDKYGAMA